MLYPQIHELIKNATEKFHFSGVISIEERGKIIFEKAYGYADRSNKILNTVKTRFGMASGSKFFTALGIGKLIEEGKIKLDSRFCDLVKSNFPNFAPDITVRHLLTHTSGVFDHYDEDLVEDFDNYYLSLPWYFLETPSDYIPIFQDQGMKFQPGDKFCYSNGGYILLGIIIEDVTGLKYRDFIKQQIFKPCEMYDSGFFAMNKLPDRTAIGYMDKKDGTWQTNIYNLPIRGASDGGAYTTVNDLKKMWRCFNSYSILNEELTALFKTKHVEINPSRDVFYGLGMYIIGNDTNLLIGLMGEDAGVGFNTKFVEEKDWIISIISNTTSGEAPIYKALLPFLKK
ncbi:serine hydrolase domain-containing protein [Candidatus Lokiarchaeum ossiferum]|uniref:serine hydrolase domain-containing protein n=1 Tax=Candidatus Lokiarchaeum ossiferum TaxID=2951803 RepID=UPI00352D1172